ncbi:aminomethyltransferase [Carnobacterium iners]|uniref:Aminomethyltransferase n=1 Tax=Carnobacterium iners TaxID=1073423 RepID=A0A1X7N723_9LACT|nr:glycine cleavage system aminomethyltransferase GcvT [Carnobacterium iners]SEL28801.1 aminomethyltransferase [Carnobacterium iners]SMH32415.1 aminomethyltransferase [Carnobacterium iners]
MTLKNNLKQTPLFNYYQKNKIKLVDFGGWAMPIQFTGIIEEHKAVRNEAGLFDVSHMGEFLVEGEDAKTYLNALLTNDVSKIVVGESQYHAMCYPDGGTVDDLILSKLAENSYLVTVNAGNIQKDYHWMKEKIIKKVTLTDTSDLIGLLAIQGPLAERILQKLTKDDLSVIQSFHFKQQLSIAGIDDIMVSRTGYTGEDGFELYLAADKAAQLWEALLEAGKEMGLKPCGLGSRDTLRLESAYSLYGHELTADSSQLQAGIGFVVKTTKPTNFVGKKVLKQQRKVGMQQKIRGFELLGKGIARAGCKIYDDRGKEIGIVTSGTKSPTLNKSIGLAFINIENSERGSRLQVEIRTKLIEAILVETPFYKREIK